MKIMKVNVNHKNRSWKIKDKFGDKSNPDIPPYSSFVLALSLTPTSPIFFTCLLFSMVWFNSERFQRQPWRWSLFLAQNENYFLFEILLDLNQVVPDHLADKRMIRWCIRLTRLTFVCEVIRYRLVQVRQNLKKKKKKDLPGWRLTIAFLHLFLFHSLLPLTSILSQNKNQSKTFFCLVRAVKILGTGPDKLIYACLGGSHLVDSAPLTTCRLSEAIGSWSLQHAVRAQENRRIFFLHYNFLFARKTAGKKPQTWA